MKFKNPVQTSKKLFQERFQKHMSTKLSWKLSKSQEIHKNPYKSHSCTLKNFSTGSHRYTKSQGSQHNDFLFMLSSHSSDNMKWYLPHILFFSSHPRTNFFFDNFSSLPSYSFVNIIRISFLCFLWKIHQDVKESRRGKIARNRRFQCQKSSAGL